MRAAHPSDSAAQREAEADMLAALSGELGVVLDPKTWHLPNGNRMQIDGYGSDGTRSYLVEAYARVGLLKGAQLKKVATDVLKLIVAAENPQAGAGTPTMMLVFASEQALGCIGGWLLEAVESHGIELRVVEPSPEILGRVRRAQQEQVMVNIADATDTRDET